MAFLMDFHCEGGKIYHIFNTPRLADVTLPEKSRGSFFRDFSFKEIERRDNSIWRNNDKIIALVLQGTVQVKN